MSRIPIGLFVGFLGSGKTTMLREVLGRRPVRQRWACVVNEFGAVDVDSARLEGAGADLRAIPGGSIFCKCLVTEFVRILGALAEDQAGSGYDAVLIEASGIADPRVVGRLLEETGLARRFNLATVVALVDPGTFFKLRLTLPNLQAQIEAADQLILNKVDCYSETQIHKTEAELRQINPKALIHRCSFGRADLNLFSTPESRVRTEGELASCRDPAFATCQVVHRASVAEEPLRLAVQNVGSHLYRLKGHLMIGRRMRSVDYCETGLVLRAPAQPDATAELVAIYASDYEEEVRKVLLRPLVRGEWDQSRETGEIASI